MSLYSVETKMNPAEAIRKAVAYFGPGGLGLQVSQQDDCGAYFAGGGGHVHVMAVAGDKTAVELETREWDYHVRRFMQDIKV